MTRTNIFYPFPKEILMAKLKCFLGNYDGTRQGLIITSSRTKAAQIAECWVHSFQLHWGEYGDKYAAGLKPDTLYTRLFSSSYVGDNNPFQEGRCPLKER
jgi:hypothetical protein